MRLSPLTSTLTTASADGLQLAVGVEAALDVDAETVDLEEVRHPCEAAAGEKLERGVGALIGVALRLALLDLGEQPVEARVGAVEAEPERSSSAMRFERPAWSETMTRRRLPTASGLHVLVGLRRLQDRRGMDAGLGGEGGGADIGRLAVRARGSTARRRRARRASVSEAPRARCRSRSARRRPASAAASG